MNKRVILSIIGVVILAGLVGAYLYARESANQQNNAEMQRRTQVGSTSSPNENLAETEDARASGTYVEYSSDIIEKTDGTKVLFFHAPWCPQCRMIEADIKGQESLPTNTTIIKVDYDSNQSLRQKYGVTLQTTFVMIDDSGELVRKYVAYNEPTFAALKTNLLDE